MTYNNKYLLLLFTFHVGSCGSLLYVFCHSRIQAEDETSTWDMKFSKQGKSTRELVEINTMAVEDVCLDGVYLTADHIPLAKGQCPWNKKLYFTP